MKNSDNLSTTAQFKSELPVQLKSELDAQFHRNMHKGLYLVIESNSSSFGREFFENYLFRRLNLAGKSKYPKTAQKTTYF